MASARRFAYLHARVSALMQCLWWPDPDAVSNLEQVEAALQRAGLDTDGLATPADLESRALTRLIQEGQLLVRPLQGHARSLLRHWLRRYELINLKVLVRRHLQPRNHGSAPPALLDLGFLSGLPADDLRHADDLDELLRRLESTPYAVMARQAGRSFAQRRSLFDLEAALERQYFVELARRLHALPRSGRKHAQTFLTTVLDRVNLIWLLRYRFAYGLEPPQTFFLLSTAGTSLGSALLDLVRRDSLQEVLDRLPQHLRQYLHGATTIEEVERRLEERNRQVAQTLLHSARFDPARGLAYLYLRERQLRRLYGLYKAYSLELQPDWIREAIGSGLDGERRSA